MPKKCKLLAAVLAIALMAMFALSACNIINEVVNFDDLRSLDGVEMTVEKSKYETSTTDITVAWINNTGKSLTFGDSYYLVKKENSKWKKVSTLPNIAFNDIGYMIESNSQTSHTYQLSHVYKQSNLKAGTYRIVTHYFDNADIPVTGDDSYWLYAEFEFVNERTQIDNEILSSYVKYYNSTSNSERINVSEIYIAKYFGEFNGSHVIIIDGPWGYACVLTSESVGGITFYYGSAGPYILAYKNGSFYRLNEAFNEGLLTVADLKIVANAHNYGANGNIDIADFLPKKSNLTEIDFSKYTAKYYNSIKIKDGFLRFGSLWEDNSNTSSLHIISKFDFSGNKVWDKPSTASGLVDKIYELPNDEGFLVYSDYYRYYIVKYDIDGNEEWTVNARFYQALLIENDGIVVAFGSTDISVVKMDFDWNIIKRNDLGMSINVGSIVKTPTGYVLCGHSGDWYDFSAPVFVDNNFNFIKSGNADFTSIESYVALDDGFVAVCKADFSVYRQLKKFDYDLNEIWSLDLKYPTSNNTYGWVEFAGVVKVGDTLLIAGHSTVRNCQPFVVKIDFDGNVLWESGLLANKGEVHQVIGLYEYNNGVMLLVMYYDFNLKPANFEWIYYQV